MSVSLLICSSVKLDLSSSPTLNCVLSFYLVEISSYCAVPGHICLTNIKSNENRTQLDNSCERKCIKIITFNIFAKSIKPSNNKEGISQAVLSTLDMTAPLKTGLITILNTTDVSLSSVSPPILFNLF